MSSRSNLESHQKNTKRTQLRLEELENRRCQAVPVMLPSKPVSMHKIKSLFNGAMRNP